MHEVWESRGTIRAYEPDHFLRGMRGRDALLASRDLDVLDAAGLRAEGGVRGSPGVDCGRPATPTPLPCFFVSIHSKQLTNGGL